jgi:hypothetical protein
MPSAAGPQARHKKAPDHAGAFEVLKFGVGSVFAYQ